MHLLVAASEASDTSVKVAIVTGMLTFFGVLATAVFAYLGNKRQGKPNGQGNIAEMATRTVKLVEEMRTDQLAHRQETKFLTDLLLQHMSNPDAHGGNHRVSAGR